MSSWIFGVVFKGSQYDQQHQFQNKGANSSTRLNKVIGTL
jgi:hypothetical protein